MGEGRTRLDLLFSFALGKVKEGCSCSRWERRSWGIATVFELAILGHPNRCRDGAQPEEPAPGSGLYYLLRSSSSPSPTQGDQDPTSRACSRARGFASHHFKDVSCQVATTLYKLESRCTFGPSVKCPLQPLP